jgi:hypothetical protein
MDIHLYECRVPIKYMEMISRLFVLGRLRQEDLEFEVSLVYIVRPHHQNKTKGNEWNQSVP